MLGVRSYVIQARVQQDKPGAKMPAQHRSVLGVGCVFFLIVAPGGGGGGGGGGGKELERLCFLGFGGSI